MARLVTTPDQRTLRDRFKLSGWVRKDDTREDEYFGWCESAVSRLSRIADDGAPSDKSVVLAVRAVLENDASFETHVNKCEADYLADAEHWERIYDAGGATIYHEYLVAVDKQEWPKDAP